MKPDARKKAEHRWVVDSIEEFVASIEVDGDRMITVPQSLLPSDAKQGHVLRVLRETANDGKRSTLTIEVDEVATREALAASAAQTKKGARQANDPGGDIAL
jgi:Protein of unknown function (DUF3006)